MTAGVFELAIILGASLIFGAILRTFRQPVLLGYLFVGLCFGLFEAFGLFSGSSGGAFETFHLLADLGIMFLLFLVGLEMNPLTVRKLGKTAFIVGIIQVLGTAVMGYMLASVFGFGGIEAVFIGLAFAFSSTIIVVKLLTEMHEQQALFGRMSIGILLIQDVLAILALMAIGALGTGANQGNISFLAVASGVLLGAMLIGMGRSILPRLFHRLARSTELIFIGALAWMLGVVSAMSALGFSPEVGGFIAGIALAGVAEHHEIARRVRPLRDFCILLFFVLLGSNLVVTNIFGVWPIALAFLLLVLVAKPLLVMIAMRMNGYRARSGFLTGLALAQVSEFSFVLMTLGNRLGHVSNEALALVTMVGVISIAVSAYAYEQHDRLERKLRPLLSYFAPYHAHQEERGERNSTKPTLLVGFQRTGQSIAMHLPKGDVLVMEYDPEMASVLTREGYSHMFADASDAEVFADMDLSQIRLAIMTGPSHDDNLAFLKRMREENARRRNVGEEQLRIVLRAEDDAEAEACYAAGADYVLLPHFTSGSYLGYLIAGDNTFASLAKAREAERKIMKREHERDGQLIDHKPITHSIDLGTRRRI